MSEEMERVNPITIRVDEKEYILDFSRETVQFAEARGFKWEDVPDYPATKIPELFFYACRRHQKNMAKANTDKLLERIGGMSPKMAERLKELYEATMTTLVNADNYEDAKNTDATIEF